MINTDNKKLNDPNHKGDINEYKATIWLMEKGYEVFKNTGCTGVVDLIVRNPENNEITQVQVKSVRYNTVKDNLIFRYKDQDRDYKLGIKALWVVNNTVGWSRDNFDEEYELEIIRNKYNEVPESSSLSDEDVNKLFLKYV